MKIEELNNRILKITLFIHAKHPELSKYIEEMTVTIPDEKNPKITVKGLEDYLNTLISFMKKYEIEYLD